LITDYFNVLKGNIQLYFFVRSHFLVTY